MEFSRKKFNDTKAIILSEKELYAGQLEENISFVLPAVESRLDSFDQYISAYEHCASERNVGLIILHRTQHSNLPNNTVDELCAPYEAAGSRSGLLIVAENERTFASCYKEFGNSQRLINIVLESDLLNVATLKDCIVSAWSKFEELQKSEALPSEALELLRKIATRFEDVGTISRIAQVITNRLDKNWLDELLVDAAPVLLAIPDNQKWILNNSKNLSALEREIDVFKNKSIQELATAKDSEVVKRAVVLAYKLYLSSKSGNLIADLDLVATKPSAFAPTLTKIILKEKRTIIDILETVTKVKVA